jgi:hypothetical protein
LPWRDFAAGASANVLRGELGVEVIRLVKIDQGRWPFKTGAAAWTADEQKRSFPQDTLARPPLFELSQSVAQQPSGELPVEVLGRRKEFAP